MMANFDLIAAEEDRLDDEEEEEEMEEVRQPVYDEDGNLIDEGVDACELIYEDETELAAANMNRRRKI